METFEMKSSDHEIRIEYATLLKNAIAMGLSPENARNYLKTATGHSQAIMEVMALRGIPGVAHEDGRFDYLCGSEYCKCSC